MLNFMNRKKRNFVRENGHFEKGTVIFVLIILLSSVSQLDYVSASEPLYYYDKYNITYGNWSTEEIIYQTNDDRRLSPDIYSYYYAPYWGDGYSGNGSQSYRSGGYVIHSIFFTGQNSNYYQVASYSFQYYTGNSYMGTYIWNVTTFGRMRNVNIGTISSSNVIGTKTQYPINGLHDDGYWYVRKGLVNNNPQIINKTQPTENKYFV